MAVRAVVVLVWVERTAAAVPPYSKYLGELCWRKMFRKAETTDALVRTVCLLPAHLLELQLELWHLYQLRS